MSESSSEDENSHRLREAVWSFGPQNVKINGKDGDYNDRQSRRTDVSKHQHDGNELGTTPEFQSHVAKKLGAFLDGCISEMFSETVYSEPDQFENRDEDEGFRLFSTSAPGNWMEEPLPPPLKRRPIPSSSDSDSEKEMRFREAAVSVSDILASAAQHLTEKTEEKSVTKESVIADEVTVTKKMKKKKKKRKRKASTGRSEENDTHVSEKQSNGEGMEDQTTVVENLTKKKKKKKRRRKLEEGRMDCVE